MEREDGQVVVTGIQILDSKSPRRKAESDTSCAAIEGRLNSRDLDARQGNGKVFSRACYGHSRQQYYPGN